MTKTTFLRAVAIFFIIEILGTTIWPTITYALTAGPTAPEATSFEPVDTTDMVNLTTGDLTYNIPFLEVPGPSGGYPLSLSYHAGIQPEQQASWTGLGWTLNPGSISRTVNGYPDDHHSVTNATREFWEGGESETWSVGVSVGIVGGPTVSAGVSWGQDTYRGFGMGGYLSASAGMEIGKKGGASASVGVSFFDYDGDSEKGSVNFSYGIGIGVSTKNAEGLNSSASIGFGSGGFSAGGGVSYNTPNTKSKRFSNGSSTSLLGASISTGGGGGVGLSVGGGSSSVNNSNSGRMSTSMSGFSVDIPTPIPGLNLRLARQYVRYWSDNLDEVSVNGSLYSLEKRPFVLDGYYGDPPTTNNSFFDHNAFDTYDLHDPSKSIQDYGSTEKILGGTFSDYDSYSVNAQGIAGSMRPYHLERVINRQNKTYDGDRKVVNYLFSHFPVDFPLSEPTSINKPSEFRFIDNFSNAHTYEPPNFQSASGSGFEEFLIDFDEGNYGLENGVISTKNQLAGSKHIEYYTNEQVYTNLAVGLMKARNYVPRYSADIENVKSEYNDQIGAFKITNESGVTYHFALPAYSENEMTYSGSIDDSNVKNFNQLVKPIGYAYTWYLTGITGPDFVDRSETGVPNGVLDEHDWGYWISIEYGLWAEKYGWRNPSSGFHTDIDTDYNYFSRGEKEIYYLNYIRTKSHTAIFEKEIRKDGKSVVHEFDDKTVGVTGSHNVGNVDEGGFDSKSKSGCTELEHSKSLMKLKTVYLIDNDNFDRSSADQLLNFSNTYNHQIGTGSCTRTYHRGGNVVDVHDIAAGFDKSKTIRSIELATDYSMTSGMPNSFTSEVDKLNGGSSSISDGTGRLTLNSLAYYGKEGVGGILPPLKFDYAKNFNFQEKNGDIWGLYKSDFDLALCEDNDDVGRAVTPSSAQNTDTWSLSKITTGLGSDINIQYESDTYRVLDDFKSYNINIENISKSNNSGKIKIALGVDESQYFEAGQEIDFVCLIENKYRAHYYYYGPNGLPPCGEATSIPYYNYATHNIHGTITTVTSTYIEIPSFLYSIMGYYDDNPCDDAGDGGGLDDIDDIDDSIVPCEECSGYTGTRSMLTGNMTFAGENGDVLGGGLRVSRISIDDGSIERSTVYDYNTDGHTSGVTSYEPTKLQSIILDGEKLDIREYDNDTSPARFNAVSTYLGEVFNKNMSRILTISRDIPGPGVYYEYVTIREEINRGGSITELIGYSTFQFEVFNEGMISLIKNNDTSTGNFTRGDKLTGTTYKRVVKNSSITLKDYSSRLGKLKKMVLYNGEGQKITETINHYLHDDYGEDFVESTPGVDDLLEANIEYYEPALKSQYANQGVIHETFANARFVKQGEDGLFGGGQLAPNDFYAIGVVSKRERYSTVATGVTNINHKTNITTTSKNLAYDFYSGQVTKTLSTDGYGNTYISKVIPAYRKYSGMGLTIQGGANMLTQTVATTSYKVMSETDETPIGLVSASAQTWSDKMPLQGTSEEYGGYYPVTIIASNIDNISTLSDGEDNFTVGDKIAFAYFYKRYTGIIFEQTGTSTYKVLLNERFTPLYVGDFSTNAQKVGTYRKQASYSWLGNDRELQSDGLYPYDDFREFTAWSGSNIDDQWQKNGEITLYDVYSHALEAMDVNGKYAATKLDSKQERVLATVANASYDEFAYSGAEDDLISGSFGGGVTHSGTISTSLSHTGDHSIKAMTGSDAFRYTMTTSQNRKLYASVWSSKNDGKIKYKINNGTEQTATLKPIKSASGWYLLRAELPEVATNNQVHISVEATTDNTYFDDFRVHPIDAAMTSYVYNEWGELSHILDANNLYTEYLYDGMGRLTSTKRESFQSGVQKVSETAYNYGKEVTHTVSISKSFGNVGSITLLTSNQIPHKGNTEVRVTYPYCGEDESVFKGLKIDGNTFTEGMTLYDGARVRLGLESFNITSYLISNIQGEHFVKAELEYIPNKGRVTSIECAISGGYTTGLYNYTYINDCGGNSKRYFVDILDIPSFHSLTIPYCPDDRPNGGGGIFDDIE